MIRFICKRCLTAGFVLWGVSFLTFSLMAFAPGDPAVQIAYARYGGEGNVDAETIEWIRQHEGLNQSFAIRYYHWLKHIIRFDLGRSMVNHDPIGGLVRYRLLNTLQLALAAAAVCLVISIPLGLICAIKKGTWIDTAGVSLSVLGVSIPNFWLGLLLIIVFAVELQWLPAIGKGGWRHFILPALTLGTAITAYTTRILRSSTIQAMQSEYLLAIRARGVSEGRVIGLHVVKNTLIPVVTIAGLEFGYLLEGAVIIETIFSWPGVGQLMVDAVSNHDYPLIQGLVLVFAAVFVIINLLVDILYKLLDPRINL